MPTTALVPVRADFPLSIEQARRAARVIFPKNDAGDRLTPSLDRMVEGDQWLKGDGWYGPWPRGIVTPEARLIKEETRRNFVSRNVLAEALDRHAAGVLGREPRWDFVSRKPLGRKATLTNAEQAALDEVTTAVTNWWDVTKPHRVLKQALRLACYCRRGLVRAYIHPGKIAQLVGRSPEPGAVIVPEVATLDEALSLIAVELVHPRDGAVVPSAIDGSPVSLVFYDEIAADGLTTIPRVVWEYLNEDGDTVLVDEPFVAMVSNRLPASAQRPRPAFAATLALGGRLGVVQIERDPIITPPCLQQQATINFAYSVLPKVLGDAGWMERIFVNIEPPGVWEYENGVRKPGSFKPSPFYTGPRTTHFMQGIAVENEGTSGLQTTVDSGQVIHRQPIDPEFAIKAARAAYVAFLEEVNQSHVMLSQEGEASGRSHEMARADYEGGLEDSATAVNPAGRALLEVVVALAEDVLGDPGKWTDRFRAEFQCRLSTGSRTADEQQADSIAVQAGRLSLTTAMERDGIDDVAAEVARINADPAVQRAALKEQATIMQLLVAADIDHLTAAKIVGLDAKFLAMIEAAPPPETTPQPTGDPPPDPTAPPIPPKGPNA